MSLIEHAKRELAALRRPDESPNTAPMCARLLYGHTHSPCQRPKGHLGVCRYYRLAEETSA